MKNVIINYSWGDINSYLNNKMLPSKWVSEFCKLDVFCPDVFSKCQLLGKYKTIELMKNLNISGNSIALCGSWFGQFAIMLAQENIGDNYTGIDIEPNLNKYASFLNRDINYNHISADMHNIKYNKYDVIINTSCEHIKSTSKWLKRVPPNKLVILHSNNYNIPSHINICKSAKEFVQESKLKTVYKVLTLKTPMYERYIIAGLT